LLLRVDLVRERLDSRGYVDWIGGDELMWTGSAAAVRACFRTDSFIFVLRLFEG